MILFGRSADVMQATELMKQSCLQSTSDAIPNEPLRLVRARGPQQTKILYEGDSKISQSVASVPDVQHKFICRGMQLDLVFST